MWIHCNSNAVAGHFILSSSASCLTLISLSRLIADKDSLRLLWQYCVFFFGIPLSKIVIPRDIFVGFMALHALAMVFFYGGLPSAARALCEYRDQFVQLSAMAFKSFFKYEVRRGQGTVAQFLPSQSQVAVEFMELIDQKDMFILGFTGLTRGQVPGIEGCSLLALSDPRLSKTFVFLGSRVKSAFTVRSAFQSAFDLSCLLAAMSGSCSKRNWASWARSFFRPSI